MFPGRSLASAMAPAKATAMAWRDAAGVDEAVDVGGGGAGVTAGAGAVVDAGDGTGGPGGVAPWGPGSPQACLGMRAVLENFVGTVVGPYQNLKINENLS